MISHEAGAEMRVFGELVDIPDSVSAASLYMQKSIRIEGRDKM